MNEQERNDIWNEALETMAEMIRNSHKTIDEIERELRKEELCQTNKTKALNY